MTFILCVEPEVKLSVTRMADASLPEVRQKLTWSTINEPNDAIRLESFLKLWPSANEPIGDAESYGLKDDSFGVRIAVLQRMAGDPRYAKLISDSLRDKVAWVRCAAIDSLSKIDSISWESLKVLINERDPDVLFRLATLVKTHAFALPEELIDRMKNGSNPETVKIAQELKKL